MFYLTFVLYANMSAILKSFEVKKFGFILKNSIDRSAYINVKYVSWINKIKSCALDVKRIQSNLAGSFLKVLITWDGGSEQRGCRTVLNAGIRAWAEEML